jgi:hypothetical protein
MSKCKICGMCHRKHRGRVWHLYKAVRLFSGIVFRMTNADYRLGPRMAWEISREMHLQRFA